MAPVLFWMALDTRSAHLGDVNCLPIWMVPTAEINKERKRGRERVVSFKEIFTRGVDLGAVPSHVGDEVKLGELDPVVHHQWIHALPNEDEVVGRVRYCGPANVVLIRRRPHPVM